MVGIGLLLVIIYLAVVYWPITLTVIALGTTWWLFSRRKNRVKEEQYNYEEQYYEQDTSNYEQYFEILHLKSDATVQQVKEQYRRFAQMYHPDKSNKQSEHQFILVTNAKDALIEKFRLRNQKVSEQEVM
jgi:anaerobic selenocysteine-containing dehydrogenase